VSPWGLRAIKSPREHGNPSAGRETGQISHTHIHTYTQNLPVRVGYLLIPTDHRISAYSLPHQSAGSVFVYPQLLMCAWTEIFSWLITSCGCVLFNDKAIYVYMYVQLYDSIEGYWTFGCQVSLLCHGLLTRRGNRDLVHKWIKTRRYVLFCFSIMELK
jgi:hypothetical protein